MYPTRCTKVDVRTHFRKGYMRRASPIHHFSQGRRRQHTAPPSFSHGTELQDHATLSVTLRNDAASHSTPRSPSMSRAEDERTQTSDRRTNSASTHSCAPHLHRGATESPSLWPRTAASVTPPEVARLPRACHARDGRRLFSWHGRVASRDTTVPDSTWHGVSGGGASEACLAKTLAQGRSVPSQQTLV